MNDMLRGFRGILTLAVSAIIGNLGTIQDIVQQLAGAFDAALSPGGIVSVVMGAAMAIKLMITDAIPKIKGKEK